MQDVVPPTQIVAAVNKNNSLDKLCFVRYGGSIVNHKNEFKNELLQFLGSVGLNEISHQTIHYWFEQNSKPSKHNAIRFLSNYINEVIEYQSLSDERKKVYTQLVSFYKKRLNLASSSKSFSDVNIGSEPVISNINEAEERGYFSQNGRIIINIPRSFDNGIVIAESLVGLYRTYRIRFSESEDRPIVQEVLRVFKRNKGLLYEHWHLRDGVELTKFSGVVTLVGNILWFIGASHIPPERLRTMHFRYTNTGNAKYNMYRWGIVSGAISIPGSPDPASGRIFIVKDSSTNQNYGKFVKDNVRFMSKEECDQETQQVISRLIDNRITAMSNAQSTNPASNANGYWIQDTLLKVNQMTFDTAVKGLPDK